MKTWTCIILVLGQFTSMGQQIPVGKTGGMMDTTVNNVYRVTDNHVANHILTRYNMPIYEAQYFFRGNKLVKFIFGFPDL